MTDKQVMFEIGRFKARVIGKGKWPQYEELCNFLQGPLSELIAMWLSEKALRKEAERQTNLHIANVMSKK